MSFNVNMLTEGIRERHMGAQHKRLVEKWNRTGLLRGLNGQHRENMSVLLENQAAQVLREANTLGNGGSASGDIRGFQNVAFPIVRRVFGGLVANELVSIQPMSLPSGLLFYLDYTYGSNVGGSDQTGTDNDSSVYTSGQSIYNNPTGKGIQSGSQATGGQYDLLGSGFSRRHVTQAFNNDFDDSEILFGNFTDFNTWSTSVSTIQEGTASVDKQDLFSAGNGRFSGYDAQLAGRIDNGDYDCTFALIKLSQLTSSLGKVDETMVKDIGLFTTGTVNNTTNLAVFDQTDQPGNNLINLRRMNQIVQYDSSSNKVTPAPLATSDTTDAYLLTIVKVTDGQTLAAIPNDGNTPGTVPNAGNKDLSVSYPLKAQLDVGGNGDALTIPSFESNLDSQNGESYSQVSPVIPEIDIKIESLSVTAVTRKLRARWSPELAQDLNAYHSLDAEVELTQILSEQIALELDREILNDLLTAANGANFFWSRSPGKFVNKETGVEIAKASTLRPGPQFTGTVREWYETLVETIIDVANTIQRKTLRGSANFIVVGPDVATILESSVLYKPNYSLDGDGQAQAGMTIGAERVGNLTNRFTVYKDPYFPRNKILVGYKGGSYLETGYVYAPYVPLIVTPTIFAPEDFTPRKGVMTRYGKKMVRSDFYGTVTCIDMNII